MCAVLFDLLRLRDMGPVTQIGYIIQRACSMNHPGIEATTCHCGRVCYWESRLPGPVGVTSAKGTTYGRGVIERASRMFLRFYINQVVSPVQVLYYLSHSVAGYCMVGLVSRA